MQNKRVPIFIICFLLFCFMNIFIFNKIADKQYGEKKLESIQKEEVSDYNNVSIVDAKLGNPYSITTGYLKTYATKKSGIWYQSKALVQSVSVKNNITTIILRQENSQEQKLVANYYEKSDIKKGDFVSFVGTIKFEDSSLHLSKISKDEITYQDVTILPFEDLYENITLLAKQEFVINGFLVTEGNRYLLYDSKEEYQNRNTGNYFILHFETDFSYTGNQSVKVSCLLENSYTLKNCNLK